LSRNVDPLLYADDESIIKPEQVLTFMPSAFISATLPHSLIQDTSFTRINGNYKLTIMSNKEFGLPFGSISRLILMHITKLAVLTQSPELKLGKNISEYVNSLGYTVTGGEKGSIKMVKSHTERLVSSFFSFIQTGDKNEARKGMTIENIRIARKYSSWFDSQDTHNISLWDTELILDDDLFSNIINHPVPVDLVALKKISGSPLAMDIYMWSTYKNALYNGKGGSQKISLHDLQNQFGTNYPLTPEGKRNFKKNFIKCLKIILPVYQELSIAIEKDYVLFNPTKPHVQKLKY
jgi:hypothetical protein